MYLSFLFKVSKRNPHPYADRVPCRGVNAFAQQVSLVHSDDIIDEKNHCHSMMQRDLKPVDWTQESENHQLCKDNFSFLCETEHGVSAEKAFRENIMYLILKQSR